jgi:hypothetical protein
VATLGDIPLVAALVTLEETLRGLAARPPQGRFANSAIAAVKDALGDTPKKSMADPATAQAREVLQDLLFADGGARRRRGSDAWWS